MKNKNFDTVEFLAITGIIISLVIVIFGTMLFIIAISIFTGSRWLILNTLFRCKLYLPCDGYYDYDIVHKLSWLKENYRWLHIIEQDVVQIDYTHDYGSSEDQTPCLRGIIVRFARKKHAIHFKLACYNNMENRKS